MPLPASSSRARVQFDSYSFAQRSTGRQSYCLAATRAFTWRRNTCTGRGIPSLGDSPDQMIQSGPEVVQSVGFWAKSVKVFK